MKKGKWFWMSRNEGWFGDKFIVAHVYKPKKAGDFFISSKKEIPRSNRMSCREGFEKVTNIFLKPGECLKVRLEVGK